MIQALPDLMSFEEFTTWLPQDGRFELIDGVVFEMQPTGEHEDVTEFIATHLTLEANRAQLPYKFPRRALLKAPTWGTGYLPDVLVLDQNALAASSHHYSGALGQAGGGSSQHQLGNRLCTKVRRL
jgi:Uma2 family endonuclease